MTDYYPSISIKDPKFKAKLVKQFKTNGVVVIDDVITIQECDNYMDDILTCFEKLGTGIKRTDLTTWTDYNLPPQVRPGLFQCLVTNLKSVWNVRSHKNIQLIFETLYTNLRDKQITDFIVSGDGINIKPNIPPFSKPNSKDWAHVDQTIRKDRYKCVQGQAVLTNTTASFVCSPRSHLIFDKLLNKLDISKDDTSNWLKFTSEQITLAKELLGTIKDSQYQIPILSRKGSFIVWTSTLIHSARMQIPSTIVDPNDKYSGWRGIVYVCYRPKEEFTEKEIKTRISVFDDNRTTNHWGTKKFAKKPGGRFVYMIKRHSNIEKMLTNPQLVYDNIGKPKLTDTQKKLLGN